MVILTLHNQITQDRIFCKPSQDLQSVGVPDISFNTACHAVMSKLGDRAGKAENYFLIFSIIFSIFQLNCWVWVKIYSKKLGFFPHNFLVANPEDFCWDVGCVCTLRTPLTGCMRIMAILTHLGG